MQMQWIPDTAAATRHGATTEQGNAAARAEINFKTDFN
jgi:hypothetical protein